MNANRNLGMVARAEALFASPATTGARFAPRQIGLLIGTALRFHGGTLGCAAWMAAMYGEAPEAAALRMRWALRQVGAGVHSPLPCDLRRVGTAGTGALTVEA